ncbi:uncharacterized protein LOC135375339 isoform X3 [Ornithodoros turicata]|uniref:uncharacterized protein LOC135375339 isoform X3 n=1 Tax=Ornithodoros turicata TaxID=34597 RepID=UPI003139DC9E
MQNPRIKFEFVMFHGQNVPFTKDALVVEEGEVNAGKSLHSLYNFTRTKLQFIPSDIVFVFSGLGAPTACTPDHYLLEGNSRLFDLLPCVMSNITNHLTKRLNNNYALATDCFARKYQLNTSQYYGGLPDSMSDVQAFCLDEKRMKEHGNIRGLCNSSNIKSRLGRSYEETIKKEGWDVFDPVNSCFFDCCSLNYISLTIHYRVVRAKYVFKLNASRMQRYRKKAGYDLCNPGQLRRLPSSFSEAVETPRIITCMPMQCKSN